MIFILNKNKNVKKFAMHYRMGLKRRSIVYMWFPWLSFSDYVTVLIFTMVCEVGVEHIQQWKGFLLLSMQLPTSNYATYTHTCIVIISVCGCAIKTLDISGTKKSPLTIGQCLGIWEKNLVCVSQSIVR